MGRGTDRYWRIQISCTIGVTTNARGLRRGTVTAKKRDADTALYAISVASDLTGVDAQMLRVYERRGLLTPERTRGGTRRYSEDDIDRIDRIVMYRDAGLNLAGIARVLTLEVESDQLRDQVRELGGTPRNDG
jgi:MerR family transcriptional regulator, heat shock protein HspR